MKRSIYTSQLHNRDKTVTANLYETCSEFESVRRLDFDLEHDNECFTYIHWHRTVIIAVFAKIAKGNTSKFLGTYYGCYFRE